MPAVHPPEKTEKARVRDLIEQAGIIPAIRVPSQEDAIFAAGAVHRGGIHLVELTMTVPGAVEIIGRLHKEYPDLTVGAGTVSDLRTAERCLDAGAAFLTSPGFDPELVEFALAKGAVMIPGVLTPTEVMRAIKAGADLVKVFPCANVGGATYIRALRAPFPQVAIIAAGGVTQKTAGEYIHAGAIAVGVRSELVTPEAVESRNDDWIKELAGRFQNIVRRARGN